MENIVSVNGKIICGKKAAWITNFNRYVLGYGVFTTMRTYYREIFRLKEHVQRLLESAKIIGMKHSFRSREIVSYVEDAFLKSGLKDAIIRIILVSSIKGNEAKLIVVPEELKEYPRENYSKGIKVATVAVERFLPRAKSISYLQSVYAMNKAKEKGCLEALMINNKGFATEGATSNLFVVNGNKVVTPNKDILLGITRKEVIKLASEEFGVTERSIKKEELLEADEIFLTASIKGIMPVACVDEKTVGKGKPGKVTIRFMEKFQKVVEDECRQRN